MYSVISNANRRLGYLEETFFANSPPPVTLNLYETSNVCIELRPIRLGSLSCLSNHIVFWCRKQIGIFYCLLIFTEDQASFSGWLLSLSPREIYLRRRISRSSISLIFIMAIGT